jgi:hypothetical protein
MNKQSGWQILALLMATGLWATQAAAQPTATPAVGYSREPAAADKPRVLGWNKSANLGLNLAFTSSQSVVGQTDGSSQTYGLDLKGSLNRVSEGDEWRNTLSVLESTTKTPSVPTFIKSGDELKLETIYLYTVTHDPESGPYVRGLATAPMFFGQDVRATPQAYDINRRNGSSQVVNASSLRLTDGFKPLETRESLGWFLKPVQQQNLAVEVRLGLAGKQIQADGQYALHGTNNAGQLTVDELSDVNQAGLEAALGLKGKIDDKSSYEAGLETMTPFINNKASSDSRSAVELTNYDGYIKLTSNITSWAAFGYDYKLKIEPQLVSGAQQIHMLTLNLNYNLL